MTRRIYMAAGIVGTALGVFVAIFSAYCALAGQTTYSPTLGYPIAPWQHAILSAMLFSLIAKSILQIKRKSKPRE